MRILLVLHTLEPGGAPKLALDIMEKLGPNVALRTLALRDGPLASRARSMGRLDIVGRLVDEYSRLNRLVSPPLRRALEASLSSWRPDVVYVNSVASIPVARFLRFPQAPVVLHAHELDSVVSPYARKQSEHLLKWPSRYVAVSQAVSNMLTDRYGVDPGKVELVYPFVDSSMANTVTSDARRDTRLVVGGAGLMGWCKGPELWLTMAYELKHILGSDNVRFVWVGLRDDESSRQFRYMVASLGMEQDIEMLNLTDEPLKVFADFDILAMCSWEDACPLVVMENMMLGKVVACFSGSGGASEVVGTTGLVIPEFSARLMAEQISHLSRDLRRIRELGMAAKARVESMFTERVQLPKIRRMLDALTEGR